MTSMANGILAFFFMGLACFGLGMSLGKIIDKPKAECDCPAQVAVADTLSEWDMVQLAIAMTESRLNPDATGKAKDGGVLQITPIYVAEANRLSGNNYSHEDAYDIGKSLEMFGIVQSHYNPEKDLDTAIRRHNPGASSGYARKVKENLELVKRYEAVRATLK